MLVVVRMLLACLLFAPTLVRAADDPLPSWNDGPAKQAILDFITRTTNKQGSDFVAPSDRIATFDNDGTLWSEQPVYFQFAFAIFLKAWVARRFPVPDTAEEGLEGAIQAA